MKIVMGVVFAAVPAVVIGLSIGLVSWPVGLIVGMGVFGLGLDVNFRGRL